MNYHIIESEGLNFLKDCANTISMYGKPTVQVLQDSIQKTGVLENVAKYIDVEHLSNPEASSWVYDGKKYLIQFKSDEYPTSIYAYSWLIFMCWLYIVCKLDLVNDAKIYIPRASWHACVDGVMYALKTWTTVRDDADCWNKTSPEGQQKILKTIEAWENICEKYF